MKVVCVGGGPGGLYLSVLLKLADPGHEVSVAERNPTGVTHGWGVGSSDLIAPFADGDPVTAARIRDATRPWRGQVVNHPDHPDRPVVWPDTGGWCIGRHRLISLLAERATELGVRLEHEREADAAALAGEADLVVAADGVTSRFREAHAAELGTSSVLGRNKYVWLGTDRVFDAFTFAFLRSPAGWLWAHAYGYDAERSTFIVECPPETWRGLGFDTAGPEDTLRRLEELFADQLEGHRLMLPARETERVPWRGHRAVSNQRWHHGSVALLGDAAHTTHFSIGSGTRLAAEDAVALTRALQAHDVTRPGGLEGALEAYGAERRGAIRLAQRDAHYSARWLEEIHRYADLDPWRFASLFHWRRSPYLVRLPPKPYHRVRATIEETPALRRAWQRSTALRRGLYRRRHAR